ncbi:MAG: sulfatase-like hydrolase/transferase [Novipirellula sp. JB048]
MKKLLTRVASLLLVVWASALGQTSDAGPPNVLLIVSDDQRPDTIAALGNEVIRTPNLDALVRCSSVFTRAICANPICTPSRGEILSGCSGFRTGVLDFGGRRPDGFVSFAETMQRGGYETLYVGKWHNRGRPSDYGYQQTAGLFGSGGAKWMQPNQVDAHQRPVTGYTGWIFQSIDGKEKYPQRGVGLTGDISEKFADASIHLIAQPRDKPFFLHVNFTAPHDPLLVPPGFEDAYDPAVIPLPKSFRPRHPFDHGNRNSRDESLLPSPRSERDVREDLAVYYAVISHLDQQVGRILKALDDSGQRDNTIVIFTSDHGLAMGSHGLRGKQNMYEHTMNVPMLISGPGVPQDQRFDAQMVLRDLYPTVCDLVGIPIPDAPAPNATDVAGARQPIDGRSMVPVLRGERAHVHDYVFGYFRNFQRMIRGDRWKLIHYPQIDKWQLFDLDEDPDELNDLAEAPQHAEVKMQLQAALHRWQTRVGDPVLEDHLSRGRDE